MLSEFTVGTAIMVQQCRSRIGASGFRAAPGPRATRWRKSLAVLIVILVSGQAYPGRAQNVEIAGSVFVVSRDDKSKEVFSEPEAGIVAPGDVLEYRFLLHNGTAAAVSGAVLNGPIPQWTSYIGQSAHSDREARFEVRLAGEERWQTPPVIRRRTRSDGAAEDYVVPVSAYEALRWVMKGLLPVQSAAKIRYRVKVRTR